MTRKDELKRRIELKEQHLSILRKDIEELNVELNRELAREIGRVRG